MGRLVGEAYSTFDQAAAAWAASRLHLAALQDYERGSGGVWADTRMQPCAHATSQAWRMSRCPRCSVGCWDWATVVPFALTCLQHQAMSSKLRPRLHLAASEGMSVFYLHDRASTRCCAGASAIDALLPEICAIIDLVDGTDVHHQARVRCGDGSIAADAPQQATGQDGDTCWMLPGTACTSWGRVDNSAPRTCSHFP